MTVFSRLADLESAVSKLRKAADVWTEDMGTLASEMLAIRQAVDAMSKRNVSRGNKQAPKK